MANFALFALVIATVVVALSQIVMFRRGGSDGPPIANQIRRLRFEHGELTRSEVAEKIGLTRQNIAAI